MKHILLRHSFSITFVIIVFAYFLFNSENSARIYRMPGYTMGTTYTLQLVDIPESLDIKQIADEVDTILARLDKQLFSTYAENSEISRFNRTRPGTRFSVSAEFLDVIAVAKEVYQLSDGAFDITVGPLVNLWGFGTDKSKTGFVPGPVAIHQAKSLIGLDYLVVDASNSTLMKKRDIQLDLSGIAKGYAVDKLSQFFDSLNIENYFLEIGGELKIKGFKPGAQSWVPAIEKPLDDSPRIQEVFFSNGDELAVAGSGDYRNYFEENGVRYSHEIDPRTGMPISHKLAAVYVIDTSVARADALATALMVMGLDQGKAMAEKYRLAVYFISRAENDSFAEFYTDEFSVYLSEQH